MVGLSIGGGKAFALAGPRCLCHEVPDALTERFSFSSFVSGTVVIVVGAYF